MIKLWKYYSGLQEIAFSIDEPPLRVQHFNQATLVNADIQSGYFLTESELEAFAREFWEQGRKRHIIPAHKVDLGNGKAQFFNSKYQTFSDFWAQRKGRE